MSFFAAAMWSISARLILDVLAELLKKVRGLDQIDLVSVVLCQAIAYLLILFVMLTVHERERPLSDALALRRPHLGLCLLAVAIGIALHGPLTLISSDLAAAGFVIGRLLEPQPTEEFQKVNPEAYERLRKNPWFLAIRALKQ